MVLRRGLKRAYVYVPSMSKRSAGRGKSCMVAEERLYAQRSLAMLESK